MLTMKQRKVVTSFIRHREKILLLRRSKKVGSYRGRWAAVSGFLEESTPLAQALKEIHEETGLYKDQVVLINAGKPLEVVDAEIATRWIVYPFLFEMKEPEKIRLDWEHVEMRWVEPEKLHLLHTVPKLAEAYAQCVKSGE